MSCGVGHRHGSDPALLWLWCRLVTIALIRSLAWEPPYAIDAALEKTKKTKQNKTKQKQKQTNKQNPLSNPLKVSVCPYHHGYQGHDLMICN